jgi:anti-sigma regulatory factor (Ser/Thr protein kinase)
MDPVRQPTHHRFVIAEEADIGVVRRTVARYADRMPAARGAALAELVATELGTNLLRHAKPGGAMLTRPLPPAAVELIAVDHGPGIGNLPAVLAGRLDAPAGLGCGLAAVGRASTVFGVHSNAAAGTAVLSTVDISGTAAVPPVRPVVAAAAPPRRWGAVSTAIAEGCGDGWAVVDLPGGGLAVAVVDGLGHGHGASEAADAALATFAAAPSDVDSFLARANAALRITRGGAITVCRLDPAAGTVRYVSVGNVNARVLSNGTERGLVSYNGTVGLHSEQPRAKVLDADLPAGATLVVWTDGLSSRLDLGARADLLGQDPALQAAVLHRDWCRQRDDATVLVVRV